MHDAKYNVAKRQILELVDSLGTTNSDEVALLTNKTRQNASMLLMKYTRFGLLSRERLRKTYSYSITQKGIDRIIFLNESLANTP